MSEPSPRTAPPVPLALALALATLAVAPSRTAGRELDVDALLRRADAFRLAEGAMQVETRLETFRNGAPDKDRRYQVFVRPGRRTLVVSRSPVEQGQKILMLGDDFWMVLPSSQRPMRIAPAQKLLGDASAGDVATLAWAEDYAGTVAGEEEVDGVPALRLDLRARRRGVSYARIDLWLARSDARPLRADLYVASDKLAKRARFAVEPAPDAGGRPQVSSMTLEDHLQTGRETVIRYLRRRPRALGEEWWNPMFLTGHEPGESP